MTKSDRLRLGPCRFCGTPAPEVENGLDIHGSAFRVVCQACGAGGPVVYYGKAYLDGAAGTYRVTVTKARRAAIESWNRGKAIGV